MLNSLLVLIIAGLVLYLVFWLLCKFITDPTAQQIIGVILAIILLIIALRTFNIGANVLGASQPLITSQRFSF